MHRHHRKFRRMGKMFQMGDYMRMGGMEQGRCGDAKRAGGMFGSGEMFGDDAFMGRGAGRKRRRMFGAGELRLVLLKLIADEPRHGYELMKAIEELTEGGYSPSPGTLYPTLSLLEDEDAIRPVADDDTRKAYEATASGRTELEERAEEVDRLMNRLAAHGERRKPFATPEMFRAVGNLATVLKNKARSGELDESAMRDIVDLVDDLAKKIERL